MKEGAEAGKTGVEPLHPLTADHWRIVPLADHPTAIPTLAQWFFDEWSGFDGRSHEEIETQLGRNLQRDRLPITFLAMRGTEVIGTVSLDESDLPSHDHLSPWLASLYVAPEARRLGIGSALISHLLTFIRMHEVACVYLWTPGSTALYEKFGWQPLEATTCGGRPVQIMMRPS